jgi:NADPH2:quinone reductase
MKAIRMHTTGSADVLVAESIETPEPGRGQVRVRVEYAGVNFIDVYRRTGLYAVPLPSTPGGEGAGVVEAVGAGVEGLSPGDRVAWAEAHGAYAEFAIVDASRLVPVPDGVDTRIAAAVMLQGMTAHYLACSTFPLEPGDRCLVHAAAGGVGLLLTQIAKRRGAYVIGTAGSDEKAALARENGADDVIVYTRDDFAVEVGRITETRGVNVVYDSVGKSTFLKGLDVLAPLGMMVLFGQSSGSVDPIDPQILNRKGSLFLTRPTLVHYVAARDDLLWRSGELFEWIGKGELDVRIDREFPLEQAADAHRALEGRETKGKLLLRSA